MGNLVTLCNAAVPVPPAVGRWRCWMHLGGVVGFVRSGLSLTLVRERNGDEQRLMFDARLGNESMLVDVLANSTFGVSAGCTLVVRAVAFRGESPTALLVELQGAAGDLAGAVVHYRFGVAAVAA